MSADKMSVTVAIEGIPYAADIMYEYALPNELVGTVGVGSLVECPFGRGSRTVRGIVTGVRERTENKKLKSVTDVYDGREVLSAEEIGLCAYMKNRYFCTFFEAAKTVMPPGTVGGFDRILKCVGDLGDEKLNSYFALKGGTVERKCLKKDLGKELYSKCLRLVRDGRIEEELYKKHTVSDSTRRCVGLLPAYSAYVKECGNKPNAVKQKHIAVIDYLRDNGSSAVKDVCYMTGVGAGVIKTLEKYGVCECYDGEFYRNPLKNRSFSETDTSPLRLNEEQRKAADEIAAEFGSGRARLLFGITGSGKTHVFMELIDRILAQGKSVLMMIPEISLTLQIIEKFWARYGETLAVLHSALSVGERYDEYKRIKSGKARVIVGTRSAVFAPVKNLGLIIIDEEQEHTYKSEMSPKYSAKTVAGYIVAKSKALLLVASATPSFESFYLAQNGRIGMSVLRERFSGQPLPKVLVADMSRELMAGNRGIIGRVLASEIAENLGKKEQTVLFMNRRGYNSFVQCPKCKYVFVCESCGISMTYHNVNDRLICHYCGESKPAPSTCPNCGSATLKYSGYGTQKAEAEIKKLFPEARILRMDADTVGGKNSREDILSSFSRHEYDILLGTQMITKGLNFPEVTLVGVLNADASLYSSDFRAYEKTFSLITQVVGRAGRSEKSGRAVIQTFSPTHMVLEHAIKQDYEAFFAEETSLRKVLVYPPYCDVCQCVFTANSAKRAFEGADAFLREIEEKLKTEEYARLPVTVIRARQTVVPKVGGRDRVRILIKCRDDTATRRLLNEVYISMLRAGEYKDITFGIDMNPTVIY